MRFDAWQLRQDWVVRLRRRFLWSPGGAGVEAGLDERAGFSDEDMAGPGGEGEWGIGHTHSVFIQGRRLAEHKQAARGT